MVSLRSPTASWHRRSWLMANPKRASMREGPLAALFRKTEELEKDSSAGQQPAPDAATTAAASAPVAQRRPAKAPAAQSAPAPRRAQPEPDQAENPRDSGVPHPSLRPSFEDEQAPRVPSPQERLRHAFSSEIPENLMDRPAPRSPAA